MNLGNNIKSSFQVILKTYKNVDKLMKYCDLICLEYGYESVGDKFLRYKSDRDYRGWLINGFVKLYQNKEDEYLGSDWKDGPIFALEINFEDQPIVYLSKFEYEDILSWGKGISPASYWRFTDPIKGLDKGLDKGFDEEPIEDKNGYFISKPRLDIKDKYWGVERVVYTEIDLLDIDSENVGEKIFGEFDTLRNIGNIV